MTESTNTIELYNYQLPDNKIAKYPLEKRDESKLLIFDNGDLSASQFKHIANHLPESSLIVSNNTKVIRARIEFFKETGARIEVFCLEPLHPADYNISFSQNHTCTWQCIIGNLKKWKTGPLFKDVYINDQKITLEIVRIGSHQEAHKIKFSWDNSNFTFSEILENIGNIPIPPYLNRSSESSDLNNYQTIYSKVKGSVAAPTAGLHFTGDVFDQLTQKNIISHEVTLHVGAGTFKPVKSEKYTDHEMHTEHFIINNDTIPKLIEHCGNITAVGTTTVRTLESLYWLGNKLLNKQIESDNFHVNQWDPYKNHKQHTISDSLNALHQIVKSSKNGFINASTAIMITPGYNFMLIDRLITNFHQPKSTLLLLIAAFIGEEWKKTYDYALENEFRFLSYGDSCLFYKKKGAVSS